MVGLEFKTSGRELGSVTLIAPASVGEEAVTGERCLLYETRARAGLGTYVSLLNCMVRTE